jgi:hypothetical protein
VATRQALVGDDDGWRHDPEVTTSFSSDLAKISARAAAIGARADALTVQLTRERDAARVAAAAASAELAVALTRLRELEQRQL